MRRAADSPPPRISRQLTSWWRGKDSNLRRHEPADLQSAPVGRLGTPPPKCEPRILISHPAGVNGKRTRNQCASSGAVLSVRPDHPARPRAGIPIYKEWPVDPRRTSAPVGQDRQPRRPRVRVVVDLHARPSSRAAMRSAVIRRRTASSRPASRAPSRYRRRTHGPRCGASCSLPRATGAARPAGVPRGWRS
jgi:hypothetical protein